MFWGRCSSLPSFPSLRFARVELAGLALVPPAMLLLRRAPRRRFARISLGGMCALRSRTIALFAARRDLTLRQQFEPQRAGDRCCFYQTDVDHVPQSVHGTAARADQRMAGLVIVVILGTERADRDQPVSAGILELDEQPGAGDAGDAALKRRADTVGEMMRNQPIGRLALGLHRAPLGDGNLRGDFAQGLRRLALRQSTFAQPQAADQGAMHDQIGVAADGRSKMRIAPQVEAEMAVILGGIFSLGLR